ncbi:MAG: serine/threonine-protein kinase, partial [Coxiellaceae bacterium]|nr:serine/threonine-protein kinase [Coxiellaceae bacterium]
MLDENIELGSGAMGSVHSAVVNGHTVAIKTPYKANDEQFEAEVRLHMSLANSPYVIRAQFASITTGKMRLVMDYSDNRDLRYHIKEGTIPPDKKQTIAVAVINGLSFIHGAGILHGDLAPENVLLNQEWQAKIAGFSAAMRKNETGYQKKLRGNMDSIAPEVIVKKEYSERSDIYSYGSLLLQLVTGERPYGDYLEDAEFYQGVCSG